MTPLRMLVLMLLLLLLAITLVLGGSSKDTEMSLWMCGNHQGYCRRYCFSHENFVGAFGCPRKFSKLYTIIRAVESHLEQLTEQLTEEEQDVRNSDKENKEKKNI